MCLQGISCCLRKLMPFQSYPQYQWWVGIRNESNKTDLWIYVLFHKIYFSFRFISQNIIRFINWFTKTGVSYRGRRSSEESLNGAQRTTPILELVSFLLLKKKKSKNYYSSKLIENRIFRLYYNFYLFRIGRGKEGQRVVKLCIVYIYHQFHENS